MHAYHMANVSSWGVRIRTIILLREYYNTKGPWRGPMLVGAPSGAEINNLVWMHTDADMCTINLCGLRQNCLGREGVFEYEHPYTSQSYRHILYSKSVCMYIAMCMFAYTYVAYDYICTVLCRCMCMSTHSHTEYELYALCTNFGSSAQALEKLFFCDFC